MISYFPFFWSRIMPITYSNFLSETEILNAMGEHVNALAKAVNDIEQWLEESMPAEIRRQVQEEIKAAVKSLEEEIAAVRESLEDFKKLEGEWHECFSQRIDAQDEKLAQEISKLTTYVNSLNQILESKIDMAIKNTELLVELIEAKVDGNMSRVIRMIANQHKSIATWVRKYFNELSKNTIMVTSPFTGHEVTLQAALDEVVLMFACTPTTLEYASYQLTADQYAALNLTALQYMLYGIKGKPWLCEDGKSKTLMMDDIFGRSRPDPVSSAYYLTDGSPPADNYGLIAGQYAYISDRVGMYELDRRGRYWLANHGIAVYRDCVHVSCPTITVSHGGVNHLSALLTLDEDIPGFPKHDLLNEDSVAKMVLEVTVEPVDWSDGLWQYYIKDRTLVDGGIAISIDVFNDTVESVTGAACVLMVDIHGITTTY